MGRIEKTVKNAFWSIFCKLISILALFGGRTVFIYILGEQYLGVSSLFTSILNVLSLTELGFAEAITYNLYKPIAQNDKRKISEIMQYFKRIYQVIGILIFIIGVLLIPFLHYLVKDVPDIQENIKLIYILYVINSAMSYFYVYKSILLEACQQKYIVSIINTVVCLIKTILSAVVLLITKNFILYLVIEILSTIIFNIIVSHVTQKKYPDFIQKGLKLSEEEKKGIISNVKAMFFYKASGVVLTSTDNIIINTFVGTVLVGKYSNYTLITNQVYNFMLQIFNAATASIGNIVASETTQKQYSVFKRMIFFAFVIYCISSVLLWNLINPFIKLVWGEKYILSPITVIMIIINFYLIGNLTVISSFRTTNGLFVQGKYRPIIMAVLNIIISLMLVKTYGINGVLIGTIVSRLVTQAWFDPYLIYKVVFKKSVKEYFKSSLIYICITVICCIISTIINKYINTNISLLNFMLYLIISLIVSIGSIYIIYRKNNDFKYFTNIFRTYAEKIKNKFKRGEINAN